MKKKQFVAWAIDTHSVEGHGLLGRYYWRGSIPAHMEGCTIALFKTREIARHYATVECATRGGFRNARAVKVSVDVAW